MKKEHEVQTGAADVIIIGLSVYLTLTPGRIQQEKIWSSTGCYRHIHI
jgi:hypothetical protein